MQVIIRIPLLRVAAVLFIFAGCAGGGAQSPIPPGAVAPPPSGPLPGEGAIRIVPTTDGRFGLAQIFDWDGLPYHPPMSAAQIQTEAPYEDVVWGAFSPRAWNAVHPGMAVSRYTLPVEDDYSISGHDLQWWQQNHPDWILYACDGGGTPTKTLAWSGSHFTDVPLDFSNPEVVQYQAALFTGFLRANGYTALAVDNADLFNYSTGGNPNFGELPAAGDYGCGSYDARGNFRRAFGPGEDPAFAAAMVEWLKTVSDALHRAGLKMLVNHLPIGPPTDPSEAQIIAYADAIVYEQGVTDYGRYENGEAASLVRNIIPWAQSVQKYGRAFLIADYLCTRDGGTAAWNGGAPCSPDPLAIPPAQVDWALSNYALVNEGLADVYISPEAEQMSSYRPEYSTTYGSACGAFAVSANVYKRKFQNALAIVNAGGVPVSVSLPGGHTYRDIEGRPVTNPLLVAPADGYFLLTSNGCG